MEHVKSDKSPDFTILGISKLAWQWRIALLVASLLSAASGATLAMVSKIYESETTLSAPDMRDLAPEFWEMRFPRGVRVEAFEKRFRISAVDVEQGTAEDKVKATVSDILRFDPLREIDRREKEQSLTNVRAQIALFKKSADRMIEAESRDGSSPDRTMALLSVLPAIERLERRESALRKELEVMRVPKQTYSISSSEVTRSPAKGAIGGLLAGLFASCIWIGIVNITKR